jgi:TonB family protein
MDPLRATLRVRSEPAGALVRVDGQSVGTTPLDALSLTPGRHGIRLERRGYAAASQEVDGRAGERLDVSVRLERQRPGPLSTPPPPVAEGDLVTLDATVIKPRKISKSDSPSYPREAERLGLQGSVIVDILVDENGQVKDPHVIESAGILLDRAVLSAISHWRYEPARKNGVKVKVRMQVKTTFKQP